MRAQTTSPAFSTLATARIAVGVVLLAVSARLAIPTFLVPLTLQPLVVLLIGLILPFREAVGSTLAYLLIGLIGVPVFAKGGGIQYLMEPSFGYLIGFVVAAGLMSGMTGRLRTLTFLWGVGIGVVGLAALYIFGVGYLYGILYWVVGAREFGGRPLTLWIVVWGGALIFFPFDFAKTVLAAAIAPRLHRVLRSSGR